MNLNSMYAPDRLLIFGHRGAQAYAPMNTLPAFERAVEQKADGIELDVHLSKDRHPVVIHDFTVDATTDGSGNVDVMTLAELQALDAGAWFDAEFAGTRIPALQQVFEAMPPDLAINIEIKAATDGIEQVVYDCIRQFNRVEQVIVSSFNPMILQNFRKLTPDVAIGFLYHPDLPQEFTQLMMNLPHEARHPHHRVIDAIYVEQAKSRGYRINAWTVNDPERAVELRNLGVDGIITDTPDVIRRALGSV